jgi:hypothetical protein
MLGLLAALDGIYERVVADPGAVRDADLLSWASEATSVLEPPVDRRVAREVRRVIRLARRLAAFWSDRPPPDDWRSAVDEALGSRGWQPTLDLARLALDEEPSPELFEEVRFRFAVVHFRPWMEGVDYDDYLAGRRAES